MADVNVWFAFWAGLASFISPCCLPLYPSFLSYITGISVSELKSGGKSREVRNSTMVHALFFILGFTIIFMLMGLTAGALAERFQDNKDLIRQIAAILIFIMGLVMLGIFQPMWLMKERKLQLKWKPAGYLGSILIGMGFAAGWSPCVGPMLGAILALSTTEPGTWLFLISAYSLGFAIPFFVLTFFLGSTKWILQYSAVLMKIGGVLMIIISILLYTDQMVRITIFFNQHTPEWLKF
ncbi:cytochrome c biogenesis protein CcdA [Paenibacillus psychroresistens]|uniref:Cytochrome c biogenesis protein CcdA n=1 Tax=Paenibacillus psychroresistens TaxID=1778678 RepID=A0A6B8RN56_9BACL|nr:cytochrome c biogenesis protein CcdA [Paenibacillus psychroresistens]QGQ97132.1 cytochrome c biogenesis protein CcdA [Paenibacillus psychroresistens]